MEPPPVEPPPAGPPPAEGAAPEGTGPPPDDRDGVGCAVAGVEGDGDAEGDAVTGTVT